ncbi:hypothetical protein SLA2020_020540 [Shorea laevis]
MRSNLPLFLNSSVVERLAVNRLVVDLNPWSDLVGIGGSLRFPHLGYLGKRIKLALANSLMHYLPSTL